jgi:2-keto-4-pentenoate hydratase/2-oxohepta-3-ene-1,7-dioic acid hydratase in catechol pathway
MWRDKLVKLVFYNDFVLGALKKERVVDIAPALVGLKSVTPQGLLEQLIAKFDELAPKIQKTVEAEKGVPVSGVRLRPPVPKPTLLLCAIGNYREGGVRPSQPIDFFLKSPRSIIGPGDTVELPPAQATIFHHEAEIAFVIKGRAKNVKTEKAMDHVFGYTAFIDVSARGLSKWFFNHKSYDTFGPMGPALVTADEIPDPHDLDVRLWVNGDLRQEYNTSDMDHKVPQLIEWLSSIVTLETGDVVSCGTNHQGLGPVQDGDKVEIEIEKIGKMAVNARDPLKRSWPREIDLETARRVRET